MGEFNTGDNIHKSYSGSRAEFLEPLGNKEFSEVMFGYKPWSHQPTLCRLQALRELRIDYAFPLRQAPTGMRPLKFGWQAVRSPMKPTSRRK